MHLASGRPALSKSALVTALAAACLGGCAAAPGPSLALMPGPGKSATDFAQDDAACRQHAEQATGIAASAAAGQTFAASLVLGSALGAAEGAAIGFAVGNPPAGAAIGAATGLALGTAWGAYASNYASTSVQNRYDVAYVQCMFADHEGPSLMVIPPPDLYGNRSYSAFDAVQFGWTGR